VLEQKKKKLFNSLLDCLFFLSLFPPGTCVAERNVKKHSRAVSIPSST
jgi:hypothetical protein